MEGNIIIGLLMVVFWVISSLAARFGRAVNRQAESQESPPAEGGEAENPFQRALRELAEQMNVEVEVAPAQPPEQPVASEHEHTPGWHDRTASEVRPTASEHRHTPGWHERTASEIRRTASEAELAASEHVLSELEHLRGDFQGARIPAFNAIPRRPRSPFVQRLHADLTGGPSSLARAVVLREILGPPVSMRAADDERG